METANIFDKLDLRKEKVLDLTKKKNISGQKATVVVALDYSGSMSALYSNGTVQETVERLLPLGMVFDDNQSIDFYLFDNGSRKLTNVTPSNIRGYVGKYVTGSMGGTEYAPIINQIVKEMGGDNNNQSPEEISKKKLSWNNILGAAKKALGEVINTPNHSHKKFDLPVYVLFITDGENSDKAQARQALINASYYGIFFQFIGIGHENFQFLKELDNMNGRLIDNANFFQIKDLSKITDDQLYEQMLQEFPEWIPQARTHELIA